MAPSLSPGQVVVIDNLSAHEGERVRQFAEQRGAELMFSPSSYSPRISLIEESCSTLKVLLRWSTACTKEALAEATWLSLAAVTVEDARGWFSPIAAVRHGINCLDNRCRARAVPSCMSGRTCE